MWVNNGELAATFLYATPGAEGLRQALKYLNGEEVAEDRRPRHHDRDQGERRRDPEGQRPDVANPPAAPLAPRVAPPSRTSLTFLCERNS